MRAVYIGNNRLLVSPSWGGKLIVSSEDRSLMPELAISGTYELPLTKYIIKQIKPDNIVVDIGANLGYFTILLAYMVGTGGKVIAYEADNDSIYLIQENVSINYLSDRVTIINKAVYSENTTINFFVAEKYKGNSSIHKHDDDYFKIYGNDRIVERKIEAIRLDDSIGKFNKIDFVKIDIEGGEYHAFLGMKDLIENGAIKSIIFELNKKSLGKDFIKLYHLIKNWTDIFDLFFLDNEGNEYTVSIDEVFSHDFIFSVGMKRR